MTIGEPAVKVKSWGRGGAWPGYPSDTSGYVVVRGVVAAYGHGLGNQELVQRIMTYFIDFSKLRDDVITTCRRVEWNLDPAETSW